MVRSIVVLILIAACFFLSASCGGQGKPAPGTASQQVQGRQEPPIDLLVFSPHPEAKTEPILREFRQRTGFCVREVHGGTAELLFRLQGGVEKPDVFWGGGVESLEAAKELFAPCETEAAAFIPPAYRDADRCWTGFSVMTMVIVYNSSLVRGTDVPRAWKDLASPFFADRVCIPDPEKSGSAYSMLNAILLTASGGNWDLLAAIKRQANAAGIASNAPLVHAAVASGEYFAGLTSEDSALAFLHDNAGSSLTVVYPADGTVSVPDGVALVRGAEHERAAREFIEFVLSKTVQSFIARNWMRRSVRTDVVLPDHAAGPSEIYILPYDIYEAAQQRELFLERWREL